MRRGLRLTAIIMLTTLIVSILFSTVAFAATENKFYMGEVVNTGKDTGYSESKKITEDDIHFGWSLGEFFISGYSANQKGDDGNPVFLKNVGDQVTLWFCLNENIDKLNNNDKLSICEDTNGYDEYFGINKTNFGKGALIVRHRTSDNHWSEPVIYTDYLKAKTTDAYTQVDIFEEGDYEVALNYEVKETGLNIFGWKPLPSYHNYRTFFRFSVRNGNCMVYPFDVETGAELTNAAFTENGFYLDLANSKYLDIIIKKEVLNESAEGLVEDVRFNKPAKDGEQYTEEGIYTITVSNEYTEQETVKKIYVGTNDVLKAHVATGFSIEEINHQLSLGATVGADGKLIPLSNQPNSTPDTNNGEQSDDNPTTPEEKPNYTIYIISGGAALLVILLIIIIAVSKSNKKKKASAEEGGNEE